MLKITQSPTFWATVEVTTPREDGGDKPNVWEFEQQFPRLTSEQLKALNAHILKTKADDDEVSTLLILGTWIDVVAWPEGKKPADRLVMKWKRVVDDQEQLLPVNADTVPLLLTVVGTGSAITKTFYDKLSRATTGN